jgi:hypothetical protein
VKVIVTGGAAVRSILIFIVLTAAPLGNAFVPVNTPYEVWTETVTSPAA